MEKDRDLFFSWLRDFGFFITVLKIEGEPVRIYNSYYGLHFLLLNDNSLIQILHKGTDKEVFRSYDCKDFSVHKKLILDILKVNYEESKSRYSLIFE